MSLDQMLKNLQREYVQSLPEKIFDIQKHIAAGSAEGLVNAFHKLKGTGKTYGIPEISELAAAVEGICLDEPARACQAADTAVRILSDIHAARSSDSAFPLARDPRFKQL